MEQRPEIMERTCGPDGIWSWMRQFRNEIIGQPRWLSGNDAPWCSNHMGRSWVHNPDPPWEYPWSRLAESRVDYGLRALFGVPISLSLSPFFPSLSQKKLKTKQNKNTHFQRNEAIYLEIIAALITTSLKATMLSWIMSSDPLHRELWSGGKEAYLAFLLVRLDEVSFFFPITWEQGKNSRTKETLQLIMTTPPPPPHRSFGLRLPI